MDPNRTSGMWGSRRNHEITHDSGIRGRDALSGDLSALGSRLAARGPARTSGWLSGRLTHAGGWLRRGSGGEPAYGGATSTKSLLGPAAGSALQVPETASRCLRVTGESVAFESQPRRTRRVDGSGPFVYRRDVADPKPNLFDGVKGLIEIKPIKTESSFVIEYGPTAKLPLIEPDLVETPLGILKRHEVTLHCEECGRDVSVDGPQVCECGSERFGTSIITDYIVDKMAQRMLEQMTDDERATWLAELRAKHEAKG